MHEDDCRCAEFKRAAHNFPGIDRRMVDRADALNLVCDQTILLVEKQHAELLVVEESHSRAAIIDDCGEARQGQPLLYWGFHETLGRRLDDFQFDDCGFAKPLDFAQALGSR